MKRRATFLALFSLVVALGLGLAPAQAASPSSGLLALSESSSTVTYFDKAFKRTRTRYVRSLDRCVRMRVSGRIKGKRTYGGRGGTTTSWSDVRIVRPRVRADILHYNPGPSCGDSARVGKIVIKQEWKHKKCTIGINSVSVGLPWSIGAGFSCTADDRVARRSSTDGAGVYAVQSNSDTVIHYDYWSYPSKTSFVAKVRMNVRIHRKVGDGWRNDRVSAVAGVTLPGY